MKNKLIIFFLTILFIPAAQSQVPGYMGKRFIAKAAVCGMPLTGYIFSDEKPLDFNLRFSLGVDYVLSRKISIGASAESVNDIVYIDKYTTSKLSSKPTTYSSAANWYGYNLGLNMKFFLFRSSGALAPFGRYFLIEYLKNQVTVSDDGRYYASGKTELNKISTSTISFGMGTQRILFNRLIVDTNLKYGINFYGLARIRSSEVRQDYEPIYNVCSSKMFSDYLFTLSLGIGVLAF